MSDSGYSMRNGRIAAGCPDTLSEALAIGTAPDAVAPAKGSRTPRRMDADELVDMVILLDRNRVPGRPAAGSEPRAPRARRLLDLTERRGWARRRGPTRRRNSPLHGEDAQRRARSVRAASARHASTVELEAEPGRRSDSTSDSSTML